MAATSTFFGTATVRLLAFLCLSALTCSAGFGQNIATWSFQASGVAPTPVAANIMASNAAYTNPGATTAVASSRFNASQWTNASLDLGRYLEVSVTPAMSYSATITQFSINVENNNTSTILSGPTGFEVRSSMDGFVSSYTSLSIGSVTATPTNIIIPITGVSRSTATFTVRIYFWGATDPARLIRIGSVAINGTVQAPALPVELISFQGRFIANGVQLNWATAWERFADRFVVERSRDAAEFAELGTLPATGNTAGQRTYTLTDERPTDGANYYRLKQIDQDGSVNYSKTIAVVVRAKRPALVVYPNPSDGQLLHLQVRSLISPAATVQTMAGQPVAGKWLQLTETEADWQPDVPLLPGLYVMTVHDGAIRQVVKVLVR